MRDLIFSYGCECLLFMQRGVRGTPKKLDMNSVMMIIIGAAVIAILAALAWYVISNLRKNIKESDQPPSLSDHLTAFDEARTDGTMTAREYNQVKAHLSKKIIKEVRQTETQKETDDDVPKFIAK